MKFNILILIISVCSSENSVYDWHIRTINRGDTDFGDDLKMQTALNKERQQDLLKFSGYTKNIVPNSKYFYSNFDSKNSNNENVDDINVKLQNLPNDSTDKKQKDKSDIQAIFDELNNYDHDGKLKQSKTSFGKDTVDTHATFQNDVLGVKLKHSKDRNNNNTPQYEKNNKALDKNYYNGRLPPVDMESFVGTNLFESNYKKCFSSEDVALLAIRRDLEILLPKHLPESLFDDHMVGLLMNYFYICHQMVTRTSSLGTRNLMQRAFYDTLGGYLNFYMVPVTKYSFYAGRISLKTATQVLLLHEESKKFLNTNGNGWKPPLQNVLSQLKSVHIEPLYISEVDDGPSFCMQLDMNADDNQPDNDKMIVQLPKMEAENVKGYLGNIWLPFRRKRTFDLKLESSGYIVAKFYETVTKCYQFENIDQEFFNEKFKAWLMENINIHLSDEEFYPGLGAVLRIAEFLKGSQQQQQVIGIDKDLRLTLNIDGKSNNYRSYKISHGPNLKRKKTEEHKNENDLKKSQEKIVVLSTTTARTVPKSTKYLLRTFDFSTSQIAIIAIPIIAFVLVVMICCWKCCCKKKTPPVVFKPVKNSSSSSSNRFNSPVRFFHIRKKPASAVDYSSNESGSKKNKKSVKVDKKPSINYDTSGSSSPNRKKKSKESLSSKGKGKDKDSDKSNVQ